MRLGCIADDFTGATDLANNLVRAGMRVVQTIGVPEQPLDASVDAVVVALKSRTIPPAEAVKQSLQALSWLQDQGAEQIYFKYCSTFDSWYEGDVRGNIGPVTEALMQALSCDFTMATPAFPDNQRSVFKGHLFVGDVLLSDSGMRHHPLTPMTESNLVKVMQGQCTKAVGLVDHKAVSQGPDAVNQRFAQLRQQGVGVAIVDAVDNADLMRLGQALKGMKLVTGGSGVAIGLPANWDIAPNAQAAQLPMAEGLQAVVSGSCSQATRAQVAHVKAQGWPCKALDVRALVAGGDAAIEAMSQEAVEWAKRLLPKGPVLIYSTDEPEVVKAVQDQWGSLKAGHAVEQALARVASGLVQAGVGQLVVAGGETSGACVQSLAVTQLQIGAQIDPGVPWCHARLPRSAGAAAGRGLHLSLKSGNFGSEDFFIKALRLLTQAARS